MPTITPFLWFDDDLEEAVAFYTSVFPDAVVHSISRGPDGAAFVADFELAGQRLQGLNGGPAFRFTEAISLVVSCRGQDEVDRYWEALTAGGGEESMCGWLKDRFGLSWQIVPEEFLELVQDPAADRVQRVMTAMQSMRKLDIAALRAAYEGEGAPAA